MKWYSISKSTADISIVWLFLMNCSFQWLN